MCSTSSSYTYFMVSIRTTASKSMRQIKFLACPFSGSTSAFPWHAEHVSVQSNRIPSRSWQEEILLLPRAVCASALLRSSLHASPMLRYYGNKSLRIPRQVARCGQPVSTMWHLAPEAPQELFLDPALLEEAGAHGMAGGAQI
jgi:hypothetical protein